MSDLPGIVYLAINEAMPGLVKIGRTDGTATVRLAQLDNTSVPLPFQIFYAARVANAPFVERQLHFAFSDARVRANREFFRLDAARAQAVLKLVEIEDVTGRASEPLSVEDTAALEKAAKRSPVFRFSRAQIPVGVTIALSRDPTIVATVVDDRRVRIAGGEPQYLAPATLDALKPFGVNWPSVQGSNFWTYEGETLQERLERIESEPA